MIQDVKVGGYNLPNNVLKTDSGVIGKYAAASLQPEDYILSTKVSDVAPDVGLSSLNGTKQAVSVTIPSLAAGLSGKLEPGDIIELYVADYGDAKSTLKPAELQYVKLLAATTDKGVDSTERKSNSKKADDNMPSTLTVLASPVQAEKLVDYNSNGKLHAALVYRGSETNAQKFLALEDQYLASHRQSMDASPAQGTVTGGTGNGK